MEDLRTEADWAACAASFEAAIFTEQQWTHRMHLIVAAWYISRFPPAEAGVAIRKGIRHLNESLGGQNTANSGFHETLTEFWIREVREHLERHGATIESLHCLLEKPSGLWRESYTIDLPKSELARREYVAPS